MYIAGTPVRQPTNQEIKQNTKPEQTERRNYRMSEEKKKPIRANGKHIVIVVQSSFPVYTIPTTPPGPAGTGMPYLMKRLTHESSNGLCCVYITLEGNKIHPEDQAQ